MKVWTDPGDGSGGATPVSSTPGAASSPAARDTLGGGERIGPMRCAGGGIACSQLHVSVCMRQPQRIRSLSYLFWQTIRKVGSFLSSCAGTAHCVLCLLTRFSCLHQQQAVMLLCAGSASFLPGRRLRGSSNALDRLLELSPRAGDEAGGRAAAELSSSGLLAPGQLSAAGILRPPSPRPPAYRTAVASSPFSASPARPVQSAFAGAFETYGRTPCACPGSSVGRSIRMEFIADCTSAHKCVGPYRNMMLSAVPHDFWALTLPLSLRLQAAL